MSSSLKFVIYFKLFILIVRQVILKTVAINLSVFNFQFDETHLTEITKEVNEVLGKEKVALFLIPFIYKHFANIKVKDQRK